MLYYYFIFIDRWSNMRKELIFLGIETSCDETAASIVREKFDGTGEILSNIVSSQIEEHKEFGGVVPEIAARAHVEKIEFIIKKAIQEIEEKDWEKTGRELDEQINNSKIDKELKLLFQDIHQYHRRENRPEWWSFRGRRFKNTEELIEDPDCIGGLTMVGNPQPIKQSLLYKYKFPDQEYKIKKDQDVTNAQWIEFKKAYAGIIESVDAYKKILTISKGTGINKKTGEVKENLPYSLNIGPKKPLPPDKIETSIQNLIKEVIVLHLKNTQLVYYQELVISLIKLY